MEGNGVLGENFREIVNGGLFWEDADVALGLSERGFDVFKLLPELEEGLHFIDVFKGSALFVQGCSTFNH